MKRADKKNTLRRNVERGAVLDCATICQDGKIHFDIFPCGGWARVGKIIYNSKIVYEALRARTTCNLCN